MECIVRSVGRPTEERLVTDEELVRLCDTILRQPRILWPRDLILKAIARAQEATRYERKLAQECSDCGNQIFHLNESLCDGCK